MDLLFSQDPIFKAKLNALLRGKRQRLIKGSIIRLDEFVVVSTGTTNLVRGTGKAIVARKITILKR